MKITIEIEPEEAAKFFNEFVPKYDLYNDTPLSVWLDGIKKYTNSGHGPSRKEST